jgi:S-disulfanyl-L-cysteine oxidoreductase SoxD
MFKRISLFAIAILIAASAYADKYTNVGRTATDQEISAWDIDVRPDFKGLPVGSGSVEDGEVIWEAKCVSCHGTFGESNEVFTPIIGGTTEADVASGHVAASIGGSQPQKTTIMKVATISTLWDYIHRAMPWTAPKSLTPNEVFAVTAYLLNLARIIPDDFVLSNENIGEVQKLMPNRNGMSLKHGLRTVDGQADVKSVSCMQNCKTLNKVTSTYPESARSSHGNIQQQNRPFGAVRGVDTTMPPSASLEESVARQKQQRLIKLENSALAEQDMPAIAQQNNCLGCHGIKNKVIGPGFNEIAAKYKGDKAAAELLVQKVKEGTSGTWGDVAMPPQTTVSDDHAKKLVNWILKGN